MVWQRECKNYLIGIVIVKKALGIRNNSTLGRCGFRLSRTALLQEQPSIREIEAGGDALSSLDLRCYHLLSLSGIFLSHLALPFDVIVPSVLVLSPNLTASAVI